MNGKIMRAPSGLYKRAYYRGPCSKVHAVCSCCNTQWSEAEARDESIKFGEPCPVCWQRLEQLRCRVMIILYASNEIGNESCLNI